jgi:adenine-specific DNA methylase
MSVRPLIEQWFPAPAIGAESLRERGSTKAYPPINFLHVWWARRPLTASRAAVVASLLPAWPSDEEAAVDEHAGRALAALQREFPRGEAEYRAWFLRSLGILGDPVLGRKLIAAANEAGEKLAGNGYGYQRAFTASPDEQTLARIHRLARLRAELDNPPTVLDSFAGGGSIPFEAARFGFDVVANELNPVATAILHGTVVLPAALGPAFAKIIETWGGTWAERVGQRLDPFFPKDAGESIIAYVWAHTVPCPSTGRPTPLAPDYWLARGKAGRDIAIKLLLDDTTGEIRTGIVEGRAAGEWGNRSTYKQGVGTSVWTNETFSGDYIREHAQTGRMGELLLAVSVTRPRERGRQFRSPSDDDLRAVELAAKEVGRRLTEWEIADLLLSEAVAPGHKTDEPRKMGLTSWRHMFTPRQLLTNVTALEELQKLIAEAETELGPERARALALYLAFALDKAVDYNGVLSSWDATRFKVRNTFDRHDFAFKWSFAEFDGAASLIPWTAAHAATNFRNISNLTHVQPSLITSGRAARATVTLGSATDLALSPRSIDAIVTDPPYYDNVMYGECSDYFYVWLKRSLRDTWPELCTLVLSDKETEAVANPSLFADLASPKQGRRRGEGKTAADLADEHYETLLTRSFREAHRVLKDDGVLTVMFTHKRVDAWDTLGQALLDAGFSISSSWPVHTESEHSLHQAKKNAASSTILLTCTKRASSDPAYWADIRGSVAAAARRAASEFAADGLKGIDLTLSTFGPVLGVLSRNWPVYTGQLDTNGNSQVLRPDVALDLAREEVARLKKRGLLGGHSVEFDRVTDWWLLAWSDFQAAEFPYDEARKLSLALDVDLDELAKVHRLVRNQSGSTTLLTPAQRRTAKGLDVDAGVWPTHVDALHALMLVYDEDGLGAARSWLDRTGKGNDPKLHDLVAAALHAVPRTKEKGEYVRPEARTLEGLRATLFDDMPAPTDPDEAVEVLSLFDA